MASGGLLLHDSTPDIGPSTKPAEALQGAVQSHSLVLPTWYFPGNLALPPLALVPSAVLLAVWD